MTATAQTANRFKVFMNKDAGGIFGFHGRVLDTATGSSHKVIDTYIVDDFHGEQTWDYTPFLTKDAFLAACRKVMRRIGGGK